MAMACSGISWGPENFRAPKITENMHFITTKCAVTLKCTRDVKSHIVLYIDPPVVLTLHSRLTHADKIRYSARYVFILLSFNFDIKISTFRINCF